MTGNAPGIAFGVISDGVLSVVIVVNALTGEFCGCCCWMKLGEICGDTVVVTAVRVVAVDVDDDELSPDKPDID